MSQSNTNTDYSMNKHTVSWIVNQYYCNSNPQAAVANSDLLVGTVLNQSLGAQVVLTCKQGY